MDAREVALLSLYACERQGGWSDGALKRQLACAGLNSRDAALATRLCLGVIQNRTLLDFYLSGFSSIPLRRMEIKVLLSLRLGAYQLLFLDRIPHRAAVDRSVELTRTHSKNPRAPGMVNAILRSLQRSMDRLPTIPQGDQAEYLSILYSHPRWLVQEYIRSFGSEGAAQLLRANNGQPQVTAQVNTKKITARELEGRLVREGVAAGRHPWLEGCLILSHTGNLEVLPSFREGLFYIQDPSSRLSVMAAGPKAGERVLDVCAAPGGKSFAAALEMGGEGEVVSCDIHPHKKKLIANGARRLGFSLIQPTTADAKEYKGEWERYFHRVLVDAPCSGLGVIRKKPDIRYKDPEQLKNLPEVQSAILNNVCRYVTPGGTLLYSTCTLLERENGQVVEAFLASHPDFTTEAFTLPGPVGRVKDGIITLLPGVHGTDGFFIAKLRKTSPVRGRWPEAPEGVRRDGLD